MLLPLYRDKDTIFGKVHFRVENKKCEHSGIIMELIGYIGLFFN